jgi:AhpD family alkylhydroperoxidase
MTTTSYKQLTQEISANLAPLHKSQPGVMKGFGDMGKAALASGALDTKTKELIALAVGVAARCDGCIGFHTKALVRLGASEAEVHEALGVAIYMGGGPVAMYAANAVASFQEFAAAARQ